MLTNKDPNDEMKLERLINAFVTYKDYKFTILKFYHSDYPTSDTRVLLQSIDRLTIKGELLKTWAPLKDLEIDTQYYRDKILEEILNI